MLREVSHFVLHSFLYFRRFMGPQCKNKTSLRDSLDSNERIIVFSEIHMSEIIEYECFGRFMGVQ